MPKWLGWTLVGTCVAAWLVGRFFVPLIGGGLVFIPIVFAAFAYVAYQRRS